MIRAQVRSLSGRVDVAIDDRSLPIERLPRAHTMRRRIRRWAGATRYGIHGLTREPVAVAYHMVGDRIEIELPTTRCEIAIGIRKSVPFTFSDQRLLLRIFPIRGRLTLPTLEGREMARGRYGLSFVEFTEYPQSWEPLLAALAVGLAVRVQWSEVAMVMAAIAAV